MVGEEGVVTKGLEEAGGGGGCDGGEKREWEEGDVRLYVKASQSGVFSEHAGLRDTEQFLMGLERCWWLGHWRQLNITRHHMMQCVVSHDSLCVH